MEIRSFGRVKDDVKVPDLVCIQTDAYREFLQEEIPPTKRKLSGLEGILREIFPIVSHDGKVSMEFIRYELGRPRYSPEECRDLRLTYGMPFKVRLRLTGKGDTVEEDVYLGEVPIMIGGGEFIINGAERVIVTQLHRSPGIDYSVEVHATGKRLHSCRIIPERGSWLEIEVTRKDVATVRVDQSSKFPITTLIRSMSDRYSTNADILRAFYPTEKVKLEGSLTKFKGAILVTALVNKEKKETVAESGAVLTEDLLKEIDKLDVKQIEIISATVDPLILNTMAEDTARTHEEGLLKIYSKLRPGNPANLEKARALFKERFLDTSRYRLGRVGRFRVNRKLGLSLPLTEMVLTADDFVQVVSYFLKLRGGEGEIDDIDHLGNRRVRTIGELAGEEFRKGFLKLKRSVQERMALDIEGKVTPRTLINAKTVSSAIDYFFGRGELSHVVDQTNPLSQLTNERRLSALGPGGLNRKRAGFEVRDVHHSHYGRVCPIETPEGANIGLITSLGIYGTVDEHGFLVTPYRKVTKGKISEEIVYLRADEEQHAKLAPADAPREGNRLVDDMVLVRFRGDFVKVPLEEVEYIDVSPKQIVGVSAGLIPFLEHDDANRALMGSNMQRQAVPLMLAQPPLVATGMEKAVAENSGMLVCAKRGGTVRKVTADEVVITGSEPGELDTYTLRKYVGLNERTCLNHKPVVQEGQRVKAGQIIADGAATKDGELALGSNILAAFMPWDGHNFEDAIILSQRLVKDDVYTSIHIEEFEVEIRETKLGREEFTRDIPNVSEKALRNLDEHGIVRIGTRVGPGDILTGKIAPKTKTELSPEEKLLHAIFGKAGEDIKDDSLVVPSGVYGVVIDAKRFSRKAYLSDVEKRSGDRAVKKIEGDYNARIIGHVNQLLEDIGKIMHGRLVHHETKERVGLKRGMTDAETVLWWEQFDPLALDFKDRDQRDAVWGVYSRYRVKINELEDERNRKVGHIKRGDELPTGVLEMVKVYIATKRRISVGDKMAGRHGNKGVVSKVVPVEDMPHLEDGTPVDIVLNPLGVPSRMNVGQILETHLGWAAKLLGFQAVVPVFSGVSEEDIQAVMKDAGLPEDGKVQLYDGRSGEPFDQKTTVGYIYMLKLHHLVDDKIHARATGPYSLITQQPLGGKARFGGQRYGEMEVWALESYGAAHILQEMMTVKSDDVEGRTRIYEAMVKGENTLEPGTPVTFDVLMNEIKGLGLDIRLERTPGAPVRPRRDDD